MQQPAAQLPGGLIKELGLIPHDQPGGPLVANLAAFWQQISPIVPVLPTVPTHKSCAVYNLAFEALWHGRGHRFDPDQVHQITLPISISYEL
jgi:hypothetical protein